MTSPSPSPTMEITILDPRLLQWGPPSYQSDMAAAIDLVACLDAPATLAPGEVPLLISSGFAVHIADPSIAALVLPRSGLGHRLGLVLGNLVGLIDPDYTGPIKVSAWNRSPPGSAPIVLNPGDRFAQMVFVPIVRPALRIVDRFSSETERGAGGFGSTGVA
jgi:dUTP pyrophosphatase